MLVHPFPSKPSLILCHQSVPRVLLNTPPTRRMFAVTRTEKIPDDGHFVQYHHTGHPGCIVIDDAGGQKRIES